MENKLGETPDPYCKEQLEFRVNIYILNHVQSPEFNITYLELFLCHHKFDLVALLLNKLGTFKIMALSGATRM